MDSIFLQEMMFGDTTDPPDPVATTTTAAPKIAEVPAVGTNKTSPTLVLGNTSTVLDLPVSHQAANAVVDSASKILTVNKSVIVTQPEVSVNIVPVAVQQTSVVPEVQHADLPPAPKINPNIVDVITAPDAINSPIETKVQQKELTPPATITQNQKAVKPTLAPAITKASMTLEQKLMAEVKAMLANTQVDMSMISEVVGQVANELSGAAVERLPSAVQLGLKTLGPDPSAKTLSKKERVTELIGSTRGVVVYPPTPPTVKVVPKATEVKADVIVKTKVVPNVVSNITSENTNFTKDLLTEKKKLHFTLTKAKTTKIPPYLEIPTLPPKTGNMAESPEVYRTLQTILDHNPSALVKVLENTAIPIAPAPQGPKISVKSLVDINPKSDLANLQSILTDISTGVKSNTKMNNTNTPQVTLTETQFEPLVNLSATLNKGNNSAAVAAGPKMNDIKVEPLTTLITNAHDVTYEAFSSNLPTVPTVSAGSVVSSDTNTHVETVPTIVNHHVETIPTTVSDHVETIPTTLNSHVETVPTTVSPIYIDTGKYLNLLTRYGLILLFLPLFQPTQRLVQLIRLYQYSLRVYL